jgi:hypothetical protein
MRRSWDLQNPAVMLFQASFQGRLQLRNLLAQPSPRHPAISAAVAFPSASARTMAMPETPKTSLATLARLMLAVSSTFSKRTTALHQLAPVAGEIAQFPAVCYRHCHTSFPFPGATKSDTFNPARAESSLRVLALTEDCGLQAIPVHDYL